MTELQKFLKEQHGSAGWEQKLENFISRQREEEYERGYDEAMEYAKIVEKKARREGIQKAIDSLPEEVERGARPEMHIYNGAINEAKQALTNLL